MNITQQKEIVAIAKRALAMLDPEWAITGEMQERLSVALMSSSVKPGRKLKKSDLYTYQPIENNHAHVVPRGKFKTIMVKDVPVQEWTGNRMADSECLCAGCSILRGFWTRGMNATSNIANGAKNTIDAAAVRDSLKVCGCSHDADRHEEDELNNLLKCSECDCEQFHYGEDQKQAA